MPSIYRFLHIEELRGIGEYTEPIERWLAGTYLPHDYLIMAEIVETLLPNGEVLWPPCVSIEVNDGRITLIAEALEIKGQC